MESSTPPAFLDPREIARSCAEAGLPDAPTQTLLDLARRIVADPAICAAVCEAHHRVYETREDYAALTKQADALMGADADRLHALFVLDCIRLVREKHARRGVPSEISRAVNQRHAVAWLNRAVEQRGDVGIADWIPGWCRTIGSGELYRLGRLEFVLEAWDYPFRAYTNIRTNQAIVLAEAGQQFADDGYQAGPATWTATLTEVDDRVVGTPISPAGYALRKQVRLPAAEWRVALKRGDPVLDMHVPAEGALTVEALRDAMRQAEEFFDNYYPQRPFVAYICDSWLFSPQLEAMLPPNSNILRWQRQGYLLPNEEDRESFLTFTFGAKTIDLATAPQNTRLRRAVVAHLAANGRLCCGLWVLLRGDLPQFGAEPYRQASAQAIGRVSL
jgi:hypothetical protein